MSWGLRSRAAGSFFLELSFPSVSLFQAGENPIEGPSLSPPFPPPPSCLFPHTGRGRSGTPLGMQDGERNEEVGEHHSRSFPSSTPPSPSKAPGEERAFQVEGKAGAKAAD